MKVLLLLVVVVAAAVARMPHRMMRECENRLYFKAIADCLGELVDTSADGQLSAAEINAFLAAHRNDCIANSTGFPFPNAKPGALSDGEYMVKACDVDGNGQLSLDDVMFPDQTNVGVFCWRFPMVRRSLCSICHHCGFDLEKSLAAIDVATAPYI